MPVVPYALVVPEPIFTVPFPDDHGDVEDHLAWYDMYRAFHHEHSEWCYRRGLFEGDREVQEYLKGAVEIAYAEYRASRLGESK